MHTDSRASLKPPLDTIASMRCGDECRVQESGVSASALKLLEPTMYRVHLYCGNGCQVHVWCAFALRLRGSKCRIEDVGKSVELSSYRDTEGSRDPEGPGCATATDAKQNHEAEEARLCYGYGCL